MKTVGILGLGRTGFSAYKYFVKNDYNVVAFDENPEVLKRVKNNLPQNEQANIAPLEQWDFKALDFIIASPGINLHYPQHYIVDMALQFKVKIISDVEYFITHYPNYKYIGITGTNGKSTTADLLTHVLLSAGKKAGLFGNIGKPIFDVDLEQNLEYIVLELSSYQLDLMYNAAFDVAAVLNINEDHIDHHGSFVNYVQAKMKIFNNMKEGSVAIVGNEVLKHIENIKPNIIITNNKPNDTAEIEKNIIVTKDTLIDNYFEENISVLNMHNMDYLKGEHNLQNIAFVYTIARSLGINTDIIVESIKNYKGLAHRQTIIKTIKNVTFVNDSKATNPDSTLQALKTFDNLYIIMGGVAKQDNLDSLLPLFYKIKKAFLVGEAKDLFARILATHKVTYEINSSLQEATEYAYKAARNDNEQNVVLLSPACASFDMFKNFEERGEAFTKIVETLI